MVSSSRFRLAMLLLFGVLLGAVWLWRENHSPKRSSAYGKLAQRLYNSSPDFFWIPNDVYGHIHDELWSQLVSAADEPEPVAQSVGSSPRRSSALESDRIGTNAIPWLVQWMSAQPTVGDSIRRMIAPLVPVWLNNLGLHMSSSTWGEEHQRWQIAAFAGFSELGTNAEPALPALSNLLWLRKVDLPLTWAIASIGPKGIALLTNALANTSAREDAALALGLNPEASRSALPALVACVECGKATYQVLGAIGRIGGEDPRLVPALVALLEATNAPPNVELDKTMAALVLGLQGKRAQAAIPALLALYRAATPESDGTRRMLRRVLKSISADAEEMLPPPEPRENSTEWP